MSWNHPKSTAKVEAKKKKSPILRVVVAVLMVVCGIIAAWLLLAPNDAPEVDGKRHAVAKIKDAGGQVKEKTKTASRAKWRPMTVPEKTSRFTPPALSYEELVRCTTLPSNCLLKASIFKHQTDGMIGALLTAQPGDHFLADQWDDQFDRDFMESLKEPIKIEPGDSDNDRALKNAVIQAREMLSQYAQSGEKPSEIMRDAQNEIMKVTAYRDQLKDALDEFIRKKDIDGALQFCNEANELLGEYNAIPLKVTDFQVKMMKRSLARETKNNVKGNISQ